MATTIQHIELPKKARALDTSGNNNHGQIYSGRGLEFDGVTDYLDIGTTFSETNHAICVWIKVVADASQKHIFDTRDANDDAILLKIDENGLLKYELNASNIYTTIANQFDNTWIRVVATYDGTTQSLYINGVLFSSNTVTTTISTTTNAKIGSKNFASGNLFNGMMSDFQAWDAAFTQADVTYDYLNPESLALNNGGTALTESNLKLWYPMQDGHRGQQSYILDGANSGVVNATIDQDFSTNTVSAWTQNSGRGVNSYEDGFLRVTYTDENNGSSLYMASSTIAGQNYKVTFRAKGTNGYAFSAIGNNADLGNVVSNPTLTTDWQDYEFYILKSDTHFRLYQSSANDGDTLDIDDILVQPINDKHHATTVFYGDELIETTANRDFSGAGQWVAYNSSTVEIDSAKLKVTIDGGGTAQRAQIPIVRVGDGSTTSVVAGRTYQISAKLDFISGADTDIVIYYFLGGVAVSVGTITTTEATYTGIVTAGDNTTALMIGAGATENDSGSDNVFTIDDVSVKEIGVASGWTDADQQLHIPQTALQSYNELAWFDGTIASDGYVDLDNQITTSGNPWSLSFWVFHDDNGQAFDFIVGDGGNQIITLNNNTVDKLSYRDSGNTYHAISDAAIPESEWVHIAITAIANTSMTAYINGVTQTTNSDMTDTTLLLERFMRGFSSDLYHTFGTINEISYYSDVLTATEVLDLFNDGKAKSALEASGSGGLVGYWRNNGLSEWKDLKGSNDGNVTAGVTETLLIPQGVDSTRDNQGFIMNRQKDTSCLNFPTRSGDYAEVLDYGDLDFGTGDFSYECWAQYGFINNSDIGGAASGLNVVLSNGLASSSNTKGFNLLTNSSKFLARIGDGAKEDSLNIQNRDNDGDAVAYVVGYWYHIAVTRTGTTLRSYVDGAPSDYMTNMESDISVSTDTPFRISDDTVDSRDYKWPVDGVRLYSKELSDTEVLRNYNATKNSHRN